MTLTPPLSSGHARHARGGSAESGSSRPADSRRNIGAWTASIGPCRAPFLLLRNWSGKTLADHRADNRAWVKALLGVTVDLDHAEDQMASDGQTAALRYA
jgi:hypothetical protein